MDAEEVKKRVTAIELQKARDGRIDWYGRNAPVWWKNLCDLLDDTVWGEDLDDFCARWFEHSEAEMREFFRGKVREEALAEAVKELPVSKAIENRKVMSAAERARAYRERKKMEGK